MSNWVNSAGLILDIFGAVSLFFFGLTSGIHDSSSEALFIETSLTAKRAKKYVFWSRMALVLLILGFALQLLSNLI